VVDASREDALEAYEIVRLELETYKFEVGAKPEIVVANKLDLPGAREGFERLRAALPGRRVVGVSTVTNEGIPELLGVVATVLAELPKPTTVDEPSHVRVYRLAPEEEEGFSVDSSPDGMYRVRGKRVERMVAMTDLNSEEGVDHLQKRPTTRRLRGAGARGRADWRYGRHWRVGDRVERLDAW
jgi:GTP-binding protein